MYDILISLSMNGLKYIFTEAAKESCSVKLTVKKCDSSTIAINFLKKKHANSSKFSKALSRRPVTYEN